MCWLLRQMKICPNAYYNYKKDKKAEYRISKKRIQEKMLELYHEYSGNLGYQMLRVSLLRAKISLSNTTVLKYMRELRIKSMVIPKRPPYKKFENHLNREFHTDRPNEKWCTDFTYILMSDGRKRYNCSIIDLFDRSVVATRNSSHIDAQLAVQTLDIALKRNRYPRELLLHSDQGSQLLWSSIFVTFRSKNSLCMSCFKWRLPTIIRMGTDMIIPYAHISPDCFIQTFRTGKTVRID